MDEYGECWLDDFFVGSMEGIDPDLLCLFREDNKVVITSPFTDLPPQLEHHREALNEDDSLRIIYYEASIDAVRDRLDVMGYNLGTSKQAFDKWVQGQLGSAKRPWGVSSYLMSDFYRRRVEILSGLTVESWTEGLNFIRNSGLKPNKRSLDEGPHKNTLIGYMLSNDWYGYPGYDTCVPLRLAIEAIKFERGLVCDFTEFVWSEDVDYEDDFIEHGLNILGSEYSSLPKTIVLTEGKTDSWILEQSLKILYPHLQDYFYFLDFEGANIGGGVGNLANTVKAFAGAGIVNNILALFDNDTAAAAACKPLQELKLPLNIVIQHLPEMDFLKNYPTIGPSGEVNLNVNGIAASIELYLGEDVLKLDNQRLTPIQWTGYDRGMRQYQGEVLEKEELHKRFRNKLESWNGSLGHEWDGLRAILGVIFNALEEKQRHDICERPIDYYRDTRGNRY